jgi:hypothetical protein
VPCPDVAFILDADVEAARARKPEYPVEFMYKCRAAYMKLQEVLGTLTIIPPLPLEQAKQAVVKAFESEFRAAEGQLTSQPQISAA